MNDLQPNGKNLTFSVTNKYFDSHMLLRCFLFDFTLLAEIQCLVPPNH